MESEAITVYLAFVLEELQMLKINICTHVAKCVSIYIYVSVYARLCFTYSNSIKVFRAKCNVVNTVGVY